MYGKPLFAFFTLLALLVPARSAGAAVQDPCPSGDFLVRCDVRPATIQPTAITVPPGFVQTPVVSSGLSNATAMAFAPDGRLFVAEQGGKLRVIKNGTLLATPFISLTVSTATERGLLGVAFDPNFTTNHYVYVFYSATTPTFHNRISRFTANGDVAVPGSETIIFELATTTSSSHNGGALHFGKDGKLYIASGDNTDPLNGQRMTTLWGKILRINADGSIPTDNPFYTTATGNNRAIWALGLRNPFTFAVQPGTGRIFINDVGFESWEEINEGVAGANYGWPETEGPTNDPRFRSPFYAYANGDGTNQGCAITGGTFYNPSVSQYPAEYVGDYFFADYCKADVRRIDLATKQVTTFVTGLSLPVDLKVGPDGSLYMLLRYFGAVHKVTYTGSGNQPPSITAQPQSQTVTAGQSVTFTVGASGTAPLRYQWQRNGVNISGATSASYTISSTTTADNGATFRCVVSNAYGSATSASATLTVVAGERPTATITSPASGALYRGGDTIRYAGTGADPEDGTLAGSAFTWRVDFHHDTHTHPFLASTSGATSGSFVVPRTGETSANVWYRIHLTVKDSSGLTHSVSRDVRPITSTITLATNPSGLRVTLDGSPYTGPTSILSVEGMTRTLGVVSPQTVGGVTYVFSSWSDGGAATHTITTPAADTTYTATYQPGQGGENILIYGDALTSGWTARTWGSTLNLAVTSPVHSGSRAIAFTATEAWGGFQLVTETAVSTSASGTLNFAMRASQAGQRYYVYLRDEDGTALSAPLPLETLDDDPPAGAWKQYAIPLSKLNAAGKAIATVAFQSRSSEPQPAVYLDDLRLGGSSAAPPLAVYSDGLSSGWANWSWGANVNFAATSPVFAGTRSIAFTATSAWGALYLRTASSVDLAPYTTLRFALRASQAGQRYYVYLRDASGAPLTAPVPLETLDSDPSAGAWKQYAIPLTDLAAAGQRVSGIVIQSRSDSPQPALYIDEITFGGDEPLARTATDIGTPAHAMTHTE